MSKYRKILIFGIVAIVLILGVFPYDTDDSYDPVLIKYGYDIGERTHTSFCKTDGVELLRVPFGVIATHCETLWFVLFNIFPFHIQGVPAILESNNSSVKYQDTAEPMDMDTINSTVAGKYSAILSDVSDDYKGEIKLKNKAWTFYENKSLGFFLTLPSQIHFYSELVEKVSEEVLEEEKSYFISFYKLPDLYVFPISTQEYIDPIKAVEIKVTPNKFSSLEEWVNSQKKGEFSEYFSTRILENIVFDGGKAIRISSTLDNRPNIKGKYKTSERFIVYNNNKIFDISIYTSEVISQKEVNFVLENFKFINE